ncbi:hypothetical protein GCM10010174_84330 [Kutzneria viridogrisea]|uniref:Oxygen sensor histidine kinase NreB n=2 Tax=Kutzneria TaxID=43356 RepID=W5WHU5_9PSEU|nr:hypothetical protein KALB_6967 [Kutzneria albida DSM 43870]
MWLLATALILLTLASLVVRMATPSDGTTIDSGDHVLTAGAVRVHGTHDSGELQVGDQVLAIDGHPVRDVTAVPLPEDRPLVYTVLRGGAQTTANVTLHTFDLAQALTDSWAMLLLIAALLGVAIFLYRLRPANPAARTGLLIASLALLSGIPGGMLTLQAVDLVSGTRFWWWLLAQLAYATLWAAMLHFTLVFPEQRAGRGHRLAVTLVYAGPWLLLLAKLALLLPAASTSLERFDLVGSPVYPTIYLYPVLVLVALVYSYHSSADELTRHRLSALAITMASGSALYLVLWVLPAQFAHGPLLPWGLFPLVFVPAPFAVAAAILRHRALDIDVAVSRTLVYLVLSVAVAGIYLLVTVLLGMVLHPLGPPWEQVIAASVVAAAVQPLRTWAQSTINLRLFGARDDPYRLLSVLASRLETVHSPESPLPAVVQAVGTTLRLPYVAIETLVGGRAEQVASYGTPARGLVRFPLIYQGSAVGYLVAASRSPREPLRRRDHQALARVATQAGATVYAARVTADLARSKEKLVAAREEERRRLLHDLHDGVGPTLAAIALGLPMVGSTLRADPDSAVDLLDRLGAELQGAIREIRRVSKDLGPTMLSQLGLVTAVREHASALAQRQPDPSRRVDFTIEASRNGLGKLPAAVEIAAYRIICEALTNVVRHAAATRCQVRVWLAGGALRLEVTDDGRGLPGTAARGVGLDSMRERAVELGGSCVMEKAVGGGTVVSATLPLASEQD